MGLVVKVVAIVQARMGSTRLPHKVMRTICGKPMIELLLARLSHAKNVDQIVVAVPDSNANTVLVEHLRMLHVACLQGSEHDVLRRYVDAARWVDADVVVRITGDCPLIDPQLVDEAVQRFIFAEVDYFSNISPATYPDGLDIEVFSRAALEQAHLEARQTYDREHVTPFLRRSNSYRRGVMTHAEDLSRMRWTVDEPADLVVINRIFEHFAPDIYFSWTDVLELARNKAGLFVDNKQIIRNEGAAMGSGQKLWRRGKAVIPGGNMLLSKRAEMFLPDQWPAYFSKAKGCQVWDLDGHQYTDMALMGVGTNVLGYGHPEVDEAVAQTVAAGNMSTLNCPEEVYLAEKLIELHPWADMVRLARSGGEANAIAIRIARAASGKDKIAVCGYHGWHDWYLSANLGDERNLAGHLLPGLDPKGVPENLRGTVFPFNYNCYEELEALVDAHGIGVIKMEVSRNTGPQEGFLNKVRRLATERGIVLIFDECTSGFRQANGGLHKIYGVDPDIAIFGKALGNGYAITAVIGRRDIMECAQSTFISSTFWTERIGPSAALKTLEVMGRMESWDIITRIGGDVRKRWQELADKYGLQIEHWGLPALAGYTFKSTNALAYKTLITQEMLAKGFLASNSLYACVEHTQDVVDKYFDALDPVFKSIKECEEGLDVSTLLKGPICHSAFKRLN